MVQCLGLGHDAPGYFDTMISWLLERVEVNR